MEAWLCVPIILAPVAHWLMYAQAQSDLQSLSGGAGWVGTGLLGTVLAWLLGIHLPAKDKQIKEMIESRDKLALDMAKMAAESDKGRRDDFKDALKVISTDFKDSLKTVGEYTTGEMRHLTAAVEELRRVMQSATGVVGFEARTAAHQRSITAATDKATQ